jgi:methionyl-tRNA formyltransferase
MKVVFAGTPDFATEALAAILASEHRVSLALTQPDRAAGRGLRFIPSPVKALAKRHGVPTFQPDNLKSQPAQEVLRAVAPDVMVIAAYGLILPPAVLSIPRLGCINIHASLLPRWRGAAPIQRAILAGDRESGITIMRMDPGLDTGPMLMRESVPIESVETGGSLHDKLAALGARLIVAALDALERGTLAETPQPAEGVTYAAKINKSEARIDWSEDAVSVGRKVRAFVPYPIAQTTLSGESIKVWRTRVETRQGEAAPAEILHAADDGIAVACGTGAIVITELQRAGGRRLPTADFLRGFKLAPGQRFAT